MKNEEHDQAIGEEGSVGAERAIFISYLGINKYLLRLIKSINEGFHIAVHIYNHLLPQKKKSWKLKTQYKQITEKNRNRKEATV